MIICADCIAQYPSRTAPRHLCESPALRNTYGKPLPSKLLFVQMGLLRPKVILGIVKTGFQDSCPPTCSLVALPLLQLYVFQVSFLFQMCFILFYPEKVTPLSRF